MNTEISDSDEDIAKLLCRLAAGELRGDERLWLFNWLDEDPSRWRRCAIELLETQELQQALGEWADHSAVPSQPSPRRSSAVADAEVIVPVQAIASPQVPLRRNAKSIAAIVALTALFAFMSGVVTDRQWQMTGVPVKAGAVALHQTSSPGETSVKAQPFAEPLPNRRSTLGQSRTGIPVNGSRYAPQPTTFAATDPHESLVPEYVRRQLESRGYRIESHPSIVEVPQQDGDSVSLPAEEVKVHFVGFRSY